MYCVFRKRSLSDFRIQAISYGSFNDMTIQYFEFKNDFQLLRKANIMYIKEKLNIKYDETLRRYIGTNFMLRIRVMIITHCKYP